MDRLHTQAPRHHLALHILLRTVCDTVMDSSSLSNESQTTKVGRQRVADIVEELPIAEREEAEAAPSTGIARLC